MRADVGGYACIPHLYRAPCGMCCGSLGGREKREHKHTHTQCVHTHTVQLVAEKASTSTLRPSLEAVKAVGGPRYAALIDRCWQSDSALRPSAAQMVDELEVCGGGWVGGWVSE